MALDGTRRALKKLGNTASHRIPEDEIISNLKTESDRSVIVLLGTIIEDSLKREITKRLTGLEEQERDAFFDFNGVAGTFSSKIILAKALGIIDSNTRNKLDLLRDMRNCSAHAAQSVSFSTREIVDAARNFMPPELQHVMDEKKLRNCFTLVCTAMMAQIEEGNAKAMEDAISTIKRTIETP